MTWLQIESHCTTVDLLNHPGKTTQHNNNDTTTATNTVIMIMISVIITILLNITNNSCINWIGCFELTWLRKNTYVCSPDRYQLVCSHRPHRHISCLWWWEGSGCNRQESCTSFCQPPSHWQTTGRQTFAWPRCLFSPIQPPDSGYQLLDLWPLWATRDISLPWSSSQLCQAEVRTQRGRVCYYTVLGQKNNKKNPRVCIVWQIAPYLQQHEVVDPVVFIVAGVRKTLFDFSGLSGVVFLLFDGVDPQQHRLDAATKRWDF